MSVVLNDQLYIKKFGIINLNKMRTYFVNIAFAMLKFLMRVQTWLVPRYHVILVYMRQVSKVIKSR